MKNTKFTTQTVSLPTTLSGLQRRIQSRKTSAPTTFDTIYTAQDTLTMLQSSTLYCNEVSRDGMSNYTVLRLLCSNKINYVLSLLHIRLLCATNKKQRGQRVGRA